MIIVAYECLFCYLNFSTNGVSLKMIIEGSEDMEQAVHGGYRFYYYIDVELDAYQIL